MSRYALIITECGEEKSNRIAHKYNYAGLRPEVRLGSGSQDCGD